MSVWMHFGTICAHWLDSGKPEKNNSFFMTVFKASWTLSRVMLAPRIEFFETSWKYSGISWRNVANYQITGLQLIVLGQTIFHEKPASQWATEKLEKQ